MKQGCRALQFICIINGHMSSEKCRIGGKAPKIQRSTCTPRRHLQNKDHQHHKWQQPRSWISYPDCLVAQDKQLTQYLLYPGKNGGCSQITKNPKSECPDIWIRLPRHKWPKSWSSMEDPVVPFERNLYGILLEGLLWERQFEKVLLKYGWEKVSNCTCLFIHRQKKGCSYLCMWMT